MGVLFWKQFLIAGGRVSVLEWKSLSDQERLELAQAGRILRAENIVASITAANDEHFLANLFEVAEELSEIEENQQASTVLALVRGALNEKRRMAKPQA